MLKLYIIIFRNDSFCFNEDKDNEEKFDHR